MDIVAVIAERKIATGMEQGSFDNLPTRGRIVCSLHGEAFFASWFRERIAADPDFMQKFLADPNTY